MSRAPITSFSATKLSLKSRRRTPKKRAYKSDSSRVISVKRAVKRTHMNVNPSSVRDNVKVNVKKHISEVRLRKNEILTRIEQIILESCQSLLSPTLSQHASLRLVKRKAIEIASRLGIEKFKASRKWLLSFVQHHKLLNNAAVANKNCVNNVTHEVLNNNCENVVKVRLSSVDQTTDENDSSFEKESNSLNPRNATLSNLFAKAPKATESHNTVTNNNLLIPLNGLFSSTPTAKLHERQHSKELKKQCTPIRNLFCTPPRSSSEDCTTCSNSNSLNTAVPKNGLSLKHKSDIEKSTSTNPLSSLFAQPPVLSPVVKPTFTKRKRINKPIQNKKPNTSESQPTILKNVEKQQAITPLRSLFSPSIVSETSETGHDVASHLKSVQKWQKKLLHKYKGFWVKKPSRNLKAQQVYQAVNLIPPNMISEDITGVCVVPGHSEPSPDVLKYSRSSEAVCNDLFDALQDHETAELPNVSDVEFTEKTNEEYNFDTTSMSNQISFSESNIDCTAAFLDDITSNFNLETVNLNSVLEDIDLDWLEEF